MQDQPETLRDAMERHKLIIRSEFVPLSLSRNKDEKNPSLNWRVSLVDMSYADLADKANPPDRGGYVVLTTDYSAGMAPGDDPLILLAEARLHDHETIRFYECEMVAIVQDDGTFEVSRMD